MEAVSECLLCGGAYYGSEDCPNCRADGGLAAIRAADRLTTDALAVKAEHVRWANVRALQAQRRALLRIVDKLISEGEGWKG